MALDRECGTFRAMFARLIALTALLLALPASARANDSAAEIAAGGLVLKEERRVAMRSERLTITRGVEARPLAKGGTYQAPTWRVTVEYEFVNESAEPVTTEVAFPEPARAWSPAYGSPGPRWLRAWVDGRPIEVTDGVRAFVGDRDVTAQLRALGVSPHYLQCGEHLERECEDYEFDAAYRKLGPERHQALSKELVNGGGYPTWRIEPLWHWRQTFPPGRVVRVRHEYGASPGYGLVGPGQHTGTFPDDCAGPTVQAKLSAGGGSQIPIDWVRYILLTANNWKRPIGRFELVVEHPADLLPSFCWDGPIERTSPTSVRARATDFVPKLDLTVYFVPRPK
jgi:Domain of unknown function (DUF4424)